MIFCLSQLHTGTVSCLAWLRAHEDCDGVLLSTEVYASGSEPATVYHEHVRADHQSEAHMSRTQIVMAWAHPTLIPLRDPLAALVSYHHRAEVSGQIDGLMYCPQLDVVDRWCCLAKAEPLFKSHEHVRYFAWDIFQTVEERNSRLQETARALGLQDPAPSRAGLPCENATGDYELKLAYRRGDRFHLAGMMGAAYEYLVDSESILRPFLERRGYRDLLWWES